jgi:type II secretory pathway component GspD/PulD (secretin)
MSTMLVRVDARWVEVQDRFWEQAGVTWTVIGSPFVVPGVTDGVARQTGSSTWTGSVDRASSLPTGTIAGMTTTPFTMAISHGGPVGLSAILRAGETAGQARSMSQMSITTFNGVQGNVFDGTQLAYIGDYQIVSSTFDPQIKVVTVGRGLDVKPYVSSDRKYVTLTIQPAVSSASLFTDRIRTVRVLDGINFTDQGEDDDDEVLPPATQVAEYPIEMPNVAIRKVATTATIPDRGSLLLGGFGSHQDERMSSGVPYLSDIPYLGRLFGTRARGSQRSSLYLLTTTTIIPYDELEKTL